MTSPKEPVSPPALAAGLALTIYVPTLKAVAIPKSQ